MRIDTSRSTTSTVRFLIVLLAPTMLVSSIAADAHERVPRPMHIHRVSELGLEIWTEADPRWEAKLIIVQQQPVFSAETPALTYPPAGMTWSSLDGFEFSADEIEDAARGAIHQAARNYGIKNAAALQLSPARYGDLTGFETRFSAQARGTAVDVLIFFGHETGKPAVLAHAYTLAGKLDRISEQIRRSWTHLRYLD